MRSSLEVLSIFVLIVMVLASAVHTVPSHNTKLNAKNLALESVSSSNIGKTEISTAGAVISVRPSG